MTPEERAGWLEWRRTGLGASDVAAVANVAGAYGSPWSVWADKVGLTTDDSDNADMEFGRYAESMVARWFEDKHGLYVLGEQTRCAHPDETWAHASADGFVCESPNSALADAIGGMEIKTARDSWAEGVPLHYQAQCQWSMYVTGHARWWVACYHRTLSGDPFTLHCLERDEADIALLLAAARPFWHDHVLTGQAPDVDAARATTEALNAAWPEAVDTVEADDGLAATVALLGARKAEQKILDAKVTELENRVKAALADHTALTHGIDAKGKPRVLCTWSWQDRSRFDLAGALNEYPDLDRFQVNTPVRVLRPKTMKEN